MAARPEVFKDDLVLYLGRHDVLPEGYELEVDGEEAEVVSKLGSGGTKEVYDVRVSGDRIALGLPGTAKRPGRVAENWQSALHEPEMTEVVREAGLPTNNFCEIRQADFGDYAVPALAMQRYTDHEFEIYDAKNFHGWHEFLEDYDDEEQLMEEMSPIASDIASIADNGLLLGGDSFNLCEIEGEPRLYINDLGSAEVREKVVGERIPEYVRRSINAFLNTAAPEHVDGTGLYHLTDERKRLEEGLEELVDRRL